MFKFLAGILLLYIVLCGVIYFSQKNLLFFPDKTPLKDCYFTKRSDVEVHEDKENLARFYFIKTQHSKPRGLVVHFHGNGGRACDRFSLIHKFLDMGYHIVLAEYPGYAEESSIPPEKDILASAKATINKIQSENDSLPLILYGESIGGAVATYLAKEFPQTQALILQTPLPSAVELGQHHYPYLPIKMLLNYPFPARDWAKETDVPVFLFHGTEDRIIPISYTKEFFKLFSHPQKSYLEIPNAHHNDIFLKLEKPFWEKLDSFLNKALSLDKNLDKF